MKSRTIKFALFTLFCCISVNAIAKDYEKLADATPLMLKRAKNLRDILETQNGLRSGAYLYSSTIDTQKDANGKLPARLHLLGITDVYTSFPYNGQEDEQFLAFKKFVRECTKCKIKVYARGIESGRFFVSDDGIHNLCNKIAEYNNKVEESERIIGISADLEVYVHLFAPGSSRLPI